MNVKNQLDLPQMESDDKAKEWITKSWRVIAVMESTYQKKKRNASETLSSRAMELCKGQLTEYEFQEYCRERSEEETRNPTASVYDFIPGFNDCEKVYEELMKPDPKKLPPSSMVLRKRKGRTPPPVFPRKILHVEENKVWKVDKDGKFKPANGLLYYPDGVTNTDWRTWTGANVRNWLMQFVEKADDIDWISTQWFDGRRLEKLIRDPGLRDELDMDHDLYDLILNHFNRVVNRYNSM